MLVLSRRKGETLYYSLTREGLERLLQQAGPGSPGDVVLVVTTSVVDCRQAVRLGIEAPGEVSVSRYPVVTGQSAKTAR